MSAVLRPDKTGRPRFFVTSDCRNFIHEIRRYRWADHSARVKGKSNPKEDAQKVLDHAMDCGRYLVMSSPSYYRPAVVMGGEERVHPITGVPL